MITQTQTIELNQRRYPASLMNLSVYCVRRITQTQTIELNQRRYPASLMNLSRSVASGAGNKCLTFQSEAEPGHWITVFEIMLTLMKFHTGQLLDW